MASDITLSLVSISVELLVIAFAVHHIYSDWKKSKNSSGDFDEKLSFKIYLLSLIIISGGTLVILQFKNPKVFELIYANSNIILWGIYYTVLVSLCSIFFGSLIGTIAALLIAQKKTYSLSIIVNSSLMALIYILLGIPALVLLYLTYYSNPARAFLGASIIALSINLSPFVAKIVLASIRNISQEHIDSALAFGYSPWQITRYFKINFVIRNSLQPLLVEYYTTIKLSSFAGLIGLSEIYHVSQDLIKETQDPMTAYIILAICYVFIVTPFAILADFLEERWKGIKS